MKHLHLSKSKKENDYSKPLRVQIAQIVDVTICNKKSFLILFSILLKLGLFSQSANFADSEPNRSKWSVQVEDKILRIAGNKFRIGITENKANGEICKTRGFLNGKLAWRKFDIEVEGAKFRHGVIKIPESNDCLKNKAIKMSVYNSKNASLLFKVKIPYNYETDLKILTTGKMGKIPGSMVKYGFRLIYDNDCYQDYFPQKEKRRLLVYGPDSSEIAIKKQLDGPLSKFKIASDGGYYLKRYLVIDTDPFNIKNHTARFMVSLANNPMVADTFEVNLDYRADYLFDSRFVPKYCSNKNLDDEIIWRENYSNDGSHGHNLEVYADAYNDFRFKEPLLLVSVTDLNNCKHYHYLVNTNGGTIKVHSRGTNGRNGADGIDGYNGKDGANGSDGCPGVVTTETKMNSDSTYTTITKVGPGGDGGDGGDGEDGGDGGNGEHGGYGGNGGDIFFSYTASALPFLYLIDLQSIPGQGGKGGQGGSGGKGGSGGTGGAGGSGNPAGRSGSSGRSGSYGSDGYNGNDGGPGLEGTIYKN